MDAILKVTTEMVLPVLKEWDAVYAVVMLRFGSDRYDPSFFISYDVYYNGPIPGREVREAAFPFAAGFETTRDEQKDRFLIDDVPVRLEYKDQHAFDSVLETVFGNCDGGFPESTYGFYRLKKGELIYSRGDWVDRTRQMLNEIPDSFWDRRVQALRARMDHVLTDLSSAVYSGEVLFYTLSLASFLNTLSALLFAINRRFEPAGRILNEQLRQLPVLPEEFDTRLEYLLRSDSVVTDKRKREIAELVTWSVLRLL